MKKDIRGKEAKDLAKEEVEGKKTTATPDGADSGQVNLVSDVYFTKVSPESHENNSTGTIPSPLLDTLSIENKGEIDGDGGVPLTSPHSLIPSPMLIDKISFIIQLHPEEEACLISFFQSFTTDDDYYGRGKTSYAMRAKSGYTYAFNIQLTEHSLAWDDGHKLLIQIGPKRPSNKHSVRFEYNPAVIGKEGRAYARYILSQFYLFFIAHGEYTDYFERIKVTRLDLAVDVDGASMEDLLFLRGRSQNWVFYSPSFMKGSRFMETVYLGDSKSKSRFVCYDKRKQLKTKGINLDHERTRIEARLKPMKPITQLSEITNPFSTLNIFDARKIQDGNKSDWKYIQFLDSVRYRGLQGALKLIDPKERRKFQEQLMKQAGVNWWDSGEIWESFQEAITPINLGIDYLSYDDLYEANLDLHEIFDKYKNKLFSK